MLSLEGSLPFCFQFLLEYFFYAYSNDGQGVVCFMLKGIFYMWLYYQVHMSFEYWIIVNIFLQGLIS